MRRAMTLVLLAGVLAACEDKSRIDPALTIDSGAEANIEHPVYALDTMSWVREGRVVLLDGQPYHPVGIPMQGPIVKEVGEFEGIKLYAASDDQVPYDRLLIPVKEGWQILEPGSTDSVAAGDTMRGVAAPADSTRR